MRRGEVWWASLPSPRGSGPGGRRPVLVIQSNAFNRSRIATALIAAITGNLALADAPGNVELPRRGTGLPRKSVVNVSQVLTVDRRFLTAPAGRVSPTLMTRVDEGLRLVLGL